MNEIFWHSFCFKKLKMIDASPLIQNAFQIIKREIKDIDTSDFNSDDYWSCIYDISRNRACEIEFHRTQYMLYVLAYIDKFREDRGFDEFIHNYQEENIKQEFLYCVGIDFELELFNNN